MLLLRNRHWVRIIYTLKSELSLNSWGFCSVLTRKVCTWYFFVEDMSNRHLLLLQCLQPADIRNARLLISFVSFLFNLSYTVVQPFGLIPVLQDGDLTLFGTYLAFLWWQLTLLMWYLKCHELCDFWRCHGDLVQFTKRLEMSLLKWTANETSLYG